LVALTRKKVPSISWRKRRACKTAAWARAVYAAPQGTPTEWRGSRESRVERGPSLRNRPRASTSGRDLNRRHDVRLVGRTTPSGSRAARTHRVAQLADGQLHDLPDARGSPGRSGRPLPTCTCSRPRSRSAATISRSRNVSVESSIRSLSIS
jgi:hypothetical protein